MASVLRLLHQGFSGLGATPSASPFSLDELKSSPLSPDAPFTAPEHEQSPQCAKTANERLAAEKPRDGFCHECSHDEPDEWTGGRLGGRSREWSGDDARFLEREWQGLPAPLYLAGTATSSLDTAHALAAQNLLPEWGSVLALNQTSGRGQLRRAWVSPVGNVYAALRLPRTHPFDSEAAAPAIGGLMAEALARMGCPVSLKWPNDLLQRATAAHAGENGSGGHMWRKVSGILLEERGDALIAGIGINLTSAPDTANLRDGFAFPAGVLEHSATERHEKAMKGKLCTTNSCPPVFPFWARLVAALYFCYSETPLETGQSWWPYLTQKHIAFVGQRVRLDEATSERLSGFENSERTVEGVLEGLCSSGALRLRTKSGIKILFGGSLTLLP